MLLLCEGRLYRYPCAPNERCLVRKPSFHYGNQHWHYKWWNVSSLDISQRIGCMDLLGRASWCIKPCRILHMNLLCANTPRATSTFSNTILASRSAGAFAPLIGAIVVDMDWTPAGKAIAVHHLVSDKVYSRYLEDANYRRYYMEVCPITNKIKSYNVIRQDHKIYIITVLVLCLHHLRIENGFLPLVNSFQYEFIKWVLSLLRYFAIIKRVYISCGMV